MDKTYNDILVLVDGLELKPEYRQLYRGRVIRNINFTANTIEINLSSQNSYTEEMIIIHKVPRLKIIIE